MECHTRRINTLASDRPSREIRETVWVVQIRARNRAQQPSKVSNNSKYRSCANPTAI